MRILFGVTHLGLLRHYQPVLRELVARGHTLHVVCQDATRGLIEKSDLGLITGGAEGVTFDVLPERRPAVLADFGTWVQLVMDWVRYFSPAFADATALRERVERQIPLWTRRLIAFLRYLDQDGRRLLRVLRALDAIVPPDNRWLAFVRDWAPDLVLVSPYVYVGFSQRDLVKAAHLIGVPAAACIASWDNLTNKGVISTMPDRVFVWNEAQRREAVELHGVHPKDVVVTGAQSFDRWFDRVPSRTREAFCREVGLDPGRPIVLYLGSSDFIAPREGRFVREWIRLVRAAPDPMLATAGILIRPHPKNFAQIGAIDLTEFEKVVVWPPLARTFDPAFDSDFFDSLHYSDVVVGINTSAQIEAAIVGRAVCTWRAPEFAHSQEGTPHFQHLASAERGMLYVADSPEEHLAHLAHLLRNPGEVASRTRAFVESFVRPHGLEKAGGAVFADAVDSLALVRRTPIGPSLWQWIARVVCFPVAVLVRRLNVDRPLWAWPLQWGGALYAFALTLRYDLGLRYDQALRSWQKVAKDIDELWRGSRARVRTASGRLLRRWSRARLGVAGRADGARHGAKGRKASSRSWGPDWSALRKAWRRTARFIAQTGRDVARESARAWKRARKAAARAAGLARALASAGVRRLMGRPRRTPSDEV